MVVTVVVVEVAIVVVVSVVVAGGSGGGGCSVVIDVVSIVVVSVVSVSNVGISVVGGGGVGSSVSVVLSSDSCLPTVTSYSYSLSSLYSLSSSGDNPIKYLHPWGPFIIYVGFQTPLPRLQNTSMTLPLCPGITKRQTP